MGNAAAAGDERGVLNEITVQSDINQGRAIGKPDQSGQLGGADGEGSGHGGIRWKGSRDANLGQGLTGRLRAPCPISGASGGAGQAARAGTKGEGAGFCCQVPADPALRG